MTRDEELAAIEAAVRAGRVTRITNEMRLRYDEQFPTGQHRSKWKRGGQMVLDRRALRPSKKA